VEEQRGYIRAYERRRIKTSSLLVCELYIKLLPFEISVSSSVNPSII
jgi:hypothetical protein